MPASLRATLILTAVCIGVAGCGTAPVIVGRTRDLILAFSDATIQVPGAPPDKPEDASMSLNLEPNIARPDDFYEALINAQRDRDDDEVQLMNAKLILLLANHIGDPEVLHEALAIAAR